MKQEPQFSWDQENGTAVCILSDGNNAFVGMAICDAEDQDMKSEKTGCQIALWRAEIKYYLHLKENEIKPALRALKQVYYTMKHSTHFNPNSYENKMLWRQIHQKELDLTVVNKMLTEKKTSLKDYLDEKQKFYKKIRKNRNIESLIGQK